MRLKQCIYTIAAILFLIGTASAQPGNACEDIVVIPANVGPADAPLMTGGLTIGGPARVISQPGWTLPILESTMPRDVCVTVVNVGYRTICVQLSPSQVWSIPIGRTITACAPNTTSVTATCAKGKAVCHYYWRVDKAW